MTEKFNRQQTEAKINVRAWKDPSFRQKLEISPRLALQEIGMTKLPDTLKIQVVEEQKEEWVIRLHKRPLNFMELSEEALEKVAAGQPQEAKCCPKTPS
jgi:hypothetical protein